ncbi:ankyrin repeat-containing domain protein [Leptodontidium sp. 2 PMI_412]|nr:ankyrin repeat-containing domain protein [Leptodontidium sp. 2 PMI_412]
MAWALKIAAAGWRDDIVEFLLIASGDANKKFVDCAFIKAMIPQDDWPRRNFVRKGPYEEARKERIEVVRLLLEAGADVEVTSRLGHYRHKYKETKPLHRVAQEGSRAREIFDMLLDKNVDVNSVNNEGTKYGDEQTPLFRAVLANDLYFVEQLLGKGASVTHVNKSGNTLYIPRCPTIHY